MEHLINIFIIALVAQWLIRRQLGTRRLTLEKLWTAPLAILVVSALNLDRSFLANPVHWLILAAAAILGFGVGMVRGLSNQVQFDRASNELIVQGSVTTLIVWLVTLIIQIAAKALLTGGETADRTVLATSILLVTINASIIARRLAWYSRYQALFKQ